MAATAHIDHVSDIEAREEGGSVVFLKRKARVVDLTDTDFEAVFSALDVSGVPAAGSTPSTYTNLRLQSRRPRLVDKGIVDVELEYVALADYTNTFTFSCNGSLIQFQTQLHGNGLPCTVSHTWPSNDPDYPNETQTQGVEVSALMPQMELAAEGVLARSRPHWVVDRWQGFVNSIPWADGLARHWLCTSVNYQLHDYSASPNEYVFQFVFQYNYSTNGWDQPVTFIDPRTGRPPNNIVAGVGTTVHVWHPERDFNELFPT